jgi:hypothetical protein
MTGLAVDARLRQVRRSGKGGAVAGSSTVTVGIDATSLAATGTNRLGVAPAGAPAAFRA